MVILVPALQTMFDDTSTRGVPSNMVCFLGDIAHCFGMSIT